MVISGRVPWMPIYIRKTPYINSPVYYSPGGPDLFVGVSAVFKFVKFMAGA